MTAKRYQKDKTTRVCAYTTCEQVLGPDNISGLCNHHRDRRNKLQREGRELEIAPNKQTPAQRDHQRLAELQEAALAKYRRERAQRLQRERSEFSFSKISYESVV